MQNSLNADQQQFRDIVSRFLEDKSPPSAVRTLMATDEGYDRDVWQQLCGEVGLAGTHIPEQYGGFGFGPVELGIACEQMGRYLYCGPFFASSVMAAHALLRAGSEQARESLLPGIASGATLATLVLDDLNSPAAVGRSVSESNGLLEGAARMVVDAHVADVLIVVAGSGAGLNLHEINANTPGVDIRPVEALDPTRKLASVGFRSVPANPIGAISAEQLQALWDEICVALAHEMVGGADYLLESTVDYTKIRFQFGRPIGAFQALKHRCADLLMEVEFAKAATYHAAQCLAAGSGDEYAPSMAKAMAADAYMSAAKTAIQLRGGIGFTWENDTHLWYKRAKSSEVFLGTPHLHRERMMTLLEDIA